MPFFERFTRPPKESPVGKYKTEVVSLAEELEWEEYLPIELRYVFGERPELREHARKLLEGGKAIGVKTVLRTPERLLKAVHDISTISQQNYILTWLPQLMRDPKYPPMFSNHDFERAEKEGADLVGAVTTIIQNRHGFKRIVLIDEENAGVSIWERQVIHMMNEALDPLVLDYSVHRVIADNASERTEVARSIIKALFIVGPIAHGLEHYASGIGKLFAASADDLLGETAEIMALRGSGFSWRELAKRGRILIPVFALATWGAFSVEGLLQSGRLVAAGVVFGLSAVALSLTTAIQSIFMYRKNLQHLIDEGKAVLAPGTELRMAFRQDFTNPARLGLILGAAMAPFMGIFGAVTGFMSNGWVLAAIGSTESIVAGITVMLASRIGEWRFHRKLKLRLKT